MKYELRINLPNLSATLSGNTLEDVSAAAQKIEALTANPLDLPKIVPDLAEATKAFSSARMRTTFKDAEPEWIEWRGGACPVRNGADVEMRFRDGYVSRDEDPQGWDWYHLGSICDIVAYRVFP